MVTFTGLNEELNMLQLHFDITIRMVACHSQANLIILAGEAFPFTVGMGMAKQLRSMVCL